MNQDIITRLKFAYDGDGIEFEIWNDPTTGKAYRVPIEIVRDFENAVPVEEEESTEIKNKPEVFPRKCVVSGVGMNAGYIVYDSDTVATESDLIKFLRRCDPETWHDCSDDFVLREAYETEEYFYTEWEELDDLDELYLADGTPCNVLGIPTVETAQK